MQLTRFSIVKVIVLACSLTLSGQSTSVSNSEEDTYQNQQRAHRLVLRELEVRQVSDAPMRCFLRTEIAKSIYKLEIRDQFRFARDTAFRCLEEIDKNADQFSAAQATYRKTEIFSLLQKNDPSAAVDLRRNDANNDVLDSFDLQNLRAHSDLAEVTDRLTTRIISGNVPDDIVFIAIKLGEINPSYSDQLFFALLGSFEAGRNLQIFEKNSSIYSKYLVDARIPSSIKVRFLRFLVNLGQSQLAQLEPTGLFLSTYDALRTSLSLDPSLNPALFDRAQSLVLAMEAKISSAQKELSDALKRIEESKDKLSQSISEAEKAKNNANADVLWLYCFNLAIKENKFRTSADCAMKFRSDENAAISIKDQMLVETLLPSVLKENDFESAGYILKLIQENTNMTIALFSLSERHLSLGNKILSIEKLEEGWKVLEKEEVSSNLARIGTSSVSIAMRIDQSKGFEIASRAIRIVNRLPTPKAEAILGTPLRTQHVDEISLPAAFNLVNLFRLLAAKDFDFASSTVHEIDGKDLKIAAEITIEPFRKYPLPQPIDATILESNGHE